MQSALPDRHSLSGQGSYVVSSSPAEQAVYEHTVTQSHLGSVVLCLMPKFLL